MPLNMSEVYKRADELKKQHPRCRHGQAIHNATSEMFPEIVKQLAGTDFDCYYNNHKVNDFLLKVNEMVNKKEQS